MASPRRKGHGLESPNSKRSRDGVHIMLLDLDAMSVAVTVGETYNHQLY